MEIINLCKKHFDDVVKIRRDIHMYPEIEFDVQRTAGVVVAELSKLSLEVKENIGKTGVVADLIVPGAKKCIALRADMDALPMQEMNDVAYRSRIDGKAHMCGHDVHTSMLIGAARVLDSLKDKLKVNVRFIFQPSEEKYPGGAPAMIEDGAIDGVDEIYGLHVWPELPCAHIAICPGAFLGQPDDFKIEIIGKGSHAALPHTSIDPVVIACQYVTLLQSVVSRNIDPFSNAVVSVTKIHTGTANNIIPEVAVLEGTVRTLDKNVQKKIYTQMQKLLDGITSANDASYKWDYQEGYPPTINDLKCVQKGLQVAQKIFTTDNIHYPYTAMLGGEDFAYFAQKVPGCFIALGCANEERGIVNMCHHPKFDVEEECMIYGMATHCQIILDNSEGN